MTSARRPTGASPITHVRELAADPRRIAQQLRPGRAVAAVRARNLVRRRPTAGLGRVLAPGQALRENGFTVFRRLLPLAECAALAAQLKLDAGIEAGVEFTRVDATNKFPNARQV